MTTLVIVGLTDDGEGIDLAFHVPDGQIPGWKAAVLQAAKAALWDARWTPGSVAFKVFTMDGIDLRIGENFD